MPAYKAGKRQTPPTHPGEVIRGALEALGVSVNQAALAIGMSRWGLGKLVNEQSPVTTESALLLAAYLGNGPTGADLWLRMQIEWDLWHARRAMKDRLARIKPAPRPVTGRVSQ